MSIDILGNGGRNRWICMRKYFAKFAFLNLTNLWERCKLFVVLQLGLSAADLLTLYWSVLFIQIVRYNFCFGHANLIFNFYDLPEFYIHWFSFN